MISDRKILTSIRSLAKYLKNSISVFSKKDENLFEANLWYTAAELEYALFLFSMKFQDRVEKSKWKPTSNLRKSDTGFLLDYSRKLLNRSVKSMNKGDLVRAYENAYIASDCLLEIQKRIRKRHKVFRG